MRALISLRQVVMTQGENFRLSIGALDFQACSISALTGSNGTGKSTLLKTLALLHTLQQGTISYAGFPVLAGGRTALQYRRRVTLVDQSPFLFQGSVSENLAFGLKFRGVTGKLQSLKIESALCKVGLSGFGKRKSRELSGGEVQRVALARALVLEPKVLLLDEPTSNIDKASLALIETLISDLPLQGITVIMSTHDLAQPERLAGRVVSLENVNAQVAHEVRSHPDICQSTENAVW